MTVTKKQAIQELELELARRSFYHYCKLTVPSFYKKEREFLKHVADEFQQFYESDERYLILNMPPRHGKSLTAGRFVEWVLGVNPSEKIMTGSYNETLSTTFSESVRDTIQEVKSDDENIVYSDIFPETKIKQGDAAKNLWSVEGSPVKSYLATSPTGTATGFGASIIIIDDLIKSQEEAHNANVLEKHWNWYRNTMLQRREKDAKIIIVMTRWANDDLAGMVLSDLKKNKRKHRHINFTAVTNYEEVKEKKEEPMMLCDDIFSYDDFTETMETMAREIILANYQQYPIDIEGRLYKRLKTYDIVPLDSNGELLFESIRNYTDWADKGSDFHCSINYGVYDGEAYVLDVLYTKEDMAKTVGLTADMLMKDRVNKMDVESNGGGSAFALMVEKELKQKYDSNYTSINDFHQSQNKESRILSQEMWVQNHIYMPNGWENKYPEFHEDLMTYQKEGKNKHDDAPDAITGIALTLNKGQRFAF